MSKADELKQEAEEYLDNKAKPYTRKKLCDVVNWGGTDPKERYYSELKLIDFICEFSEPREKRIEELEETIANLKEQVQSQVDATIELDKENADLKEQNIKDCEAFNKTIKETKEQWNNEHYQLAQAKEIIKGLLPCCRNYPQENAEKIEQAEQFLNGENIILEDAQAGNSPFDADEVFNKEMKAYSDETLGISDVHKYSHKLFDAFEKLEFRTTFNKAIQAFYLEEGLYVVRSESLGKYQYTLVEASSEEMAIRKCM